MKITWNDIRMNQLGPNKWELRMDCEIETVSIYFDKKDIREWAKNFGRLAKELE